MLCREKFTLTHLYGSELEEVCLIKVHYGIYIPHAHYNPHRVPQERNVSKHSRPASLKSSSVTELYPFSSHFEEEVGQREEKLTVLGFPLVFDLV